MIPPSKNWLIWSNEHGAWWRPNAAGYTAFRVAAGRYSYADAVVICDKANYAPECKDRPNETMLPDNGS